MGLTPSNILLLLVLAFIIILIRISSGDLEFYSDLVHSQHAYAEKIKSYQHGYSDKKETTNSKEFIINEFVSAPFTKYDESDITLLSQGDFDKIIQYAPKLCNLWQGPLNLAVYNHDMDLQETICYLNNFRLCDPCLNKWLSLHLATKSTERQIEADFFKGDCSAKCLVGELAPKYPKILNESPRPDSFFYPNNMLRNLARKTSLLTWEFMTDIDMVPSANLRKNFLRMIESKKNDTQLFDKRYSPNLKQAYVLPAFEVKEDSEPPKTRTELLERSIFNSENIKKNTWEIQPFHNWCDICYKKSQNYNHWAQTQLLNNPDDNQLDIAYPVTYHLPFEPYYIVSTKADCPLYDERFRGYGYNKVEQCFEMSQRKWKFLTLDTAFICHMGWKTPTQGSMAKSEQQRINTIKFKEFTKNLKVLIAKGQ